MLKSIRIICVLVCLLVPASIACGSTWYVATTGDDSGSGAADEPFLTVARGIFEGATGDTIVLQDGIYTGAGNRDLDLAGKGLTILSASGNPEACVLDAEDSLDGAGWNIYSPTDGDPVNLEGLTFRRGRLGAIRIGYWAHDPVFLHNCNIDGTGTGVKVAAVLDVYGGLISDCATGIDNQIDDFAWGMPMIVDGVHFLDCGVGVVPGTFIGKKAAELVPAFAPQAGDNSTLRDCVFENNGTGASTCVEADVLFEGCVFQGGDYGVRLYRPWPDARFTGCRFLGGAIAGIDVFTDMSVVGVGVDSCLFQDNPGDGIVTNGGDLSVAQTQILNCGGAGVRAQPSGTVAISWSVIARCGDAGLDIDCLANAPYASTVAVSHSTIAYNNAGIRVAQGDASAAAVATSVVAMSSGEGLADDGATYTDCVVFGNGADAEPDSWVPWVDGNYELDPLFCDPLNDDYHVGGLSPCTDDAGEAAIGALGVGCNDAVANEPVALLARWVPGGVEVTWAAGTGAFPQGARLARVDAGSGAGTTLESWPARAFPRTGRFLDTTARARSAYRYVLSGGDGASFEIELASRPGLPGSSRLTGIYPNPSNPRATIAYALARDEHVRIAVFDLAGRRVFSRDLGVVGAGPGIFQWDATGNDGRSVAAGSYLVRLTTDTTTDTSRLVIVK